MPRKLSTPKNPEFLGHIIAAVRLGAGEREPKNAAERELLSELRAKNLKPDVAQRMTKALDNTPADKRQQLLGPVADHSFALREISPNRTEGVIEGSGIGRGFNLNVGGTTANAGGTLGGGVAAGDDVVGSSTETVLDPEIGDGIRYTVRYQGLFCQKETTGPGSDEIYVLTTAVTVNKEQNAISDTLRHPKAHPDKAYQGVDNREQRLGPVVASFIRQRCCLTCSRKRLWMPSTGCWVQATTCSPQKQQC